MKEIVVVGGDPGGAMALAPVLRALQLHPDIRLRVFGYRQAVTLWLRHGLDVEALPDDRGVAPAELLHEDDVSLLLTATSVNGVDHERSFRNWAALSSIASVAVLDFWSNYSERFRDGADADLELPNAIAVMDARAVSEMVAEGFPPARLFVTGQPAFDAISAFRTAWSEAKRSDARRLLSTETGSIVVLFVSQPLSEMATLLGSASTPIDERDILGRVAASLDEIAARDAIDIVLAVRPHPRQQLEPRDLPSASRVRVVLATSGEPWPAVLAADLVVGMTTVLLVEACLLGCAVVSVQPGRQATDPLPTSRSGDSMAVYDLAELTGTLRRAMESGSAAKPVRRANMTDAVTATDRVVELVLTTMTNRGAGK